MKINIKARVLVNEREHEITLPQGQNPFDQTLRGMGLYTGRADEYRVLSAESNITGLNPALAHAKDIHELNCLGQLLSQFDGKGLETYAGILKSEENPLPMAQMINLAYNFKALEWDPDILDLDDLGRRYAEENDPDTDAVILRNRGDDGEILHEGIGMELQIEQGGLFTGGGYIRNFSESIALPYDGQYLPACRYGENPRLSVTVKKPGAEKGAEIFLPTGDSVIQMTLHRMNADAWSMEKYTLTIGQGFPPCHAGKTVPGKMLNTLNTLAHRLSVLPEEQADALLKDADLDNVEAFLDCCNGRIQALERPEAANTVIYRFPLEIDLWDPEEPSDYPESVAPFDFLQYEESILEQIRKENRTFDTARMLAEYIHTDSTLHQKVYSMTPTVEEHGGTLWGAMVMKVAGTLDAAEIAELKDYISGQNSDGYGEGFEQRGIETGDGDINVHFWSSDNKHYAIYTPEEFEAMLETRQGGGMTGDGPEPGGFGVNMY